MNGASIAVVEPVRRARLRTVESARFPVAGSSLISLIPVQNEPNDSHHWPDPSTIRFGSIALKSLLFDDSMTRPWLVQVPEVPLGLVARKIAEWREPNVDAA